MFKNIFKIALLWIIKTFYCIDPQSTMQRRLGEFFGLKAKRFVRYGVDSEKQADYSDVAAMIREAGGVIYSARLTALLTTNALSVVAGTTEHNPLGASVIKTKGLTTGFYSIDFTNIPEALDLTNKTVVAKVYNTSDWSTGFWDPAYTVSASVVVSGTTISASIYCINVANPGTDGDELLAIQGGQVFLEIVVL